MRKDIDDDDDQKLTGCPQRLKSFKRRCMACRFEIVEQISLEHEGEKPPCSKFPNRR